MIIIEYSSFQLFGREIAFYGLLMISGFAVAAVSAIPRAKKLGVNGWEVVYSGIFAGIGGILGAKFLSVLTSLNLIVSHKIPFVDIIRNGFVFYGGLLGGAAGIFIYAKSYKLSVVRYFDLFAPGVPLGHAFGRIGCLLSGCCYGIPVSNGISVVYISAADPATPLSTPLLPVQLIEACLLLIIYAAAECVFYKSKRSGIASVVYLSAYSAARFVLEFFRADAERGVLLGLSTSQYISLLIFVVCVATVIYGLKKKSIRG